MAERVRIMSLTARIPLLMQRVTFRAILCMIISAFCFAFVEMVGQYLVQGISLYQVVWGRYGIHILFMLVVLGPRYKSTLYKSNRLSLQILRSLTMVAMPVCALLATQYMRPDDMWSIYWTSPLVMLALASFILHEPVGLTRWIAGGIGFIAMLLVLRPDQGVISPAILLSFGVGVAISLHLMFSRILRDDHPITSLFHTALWVFVVMSFFVPVVWQMPSLRNMVGLVMIGIVGLVTLYFLARAGELAPIPVVAGFAYTEAIARLLINIVFFGVMPSKSAVLGTLIIVVLTGYMLFHELRQPEPAPETEPDAAPELVPATNNR